MREFGVLIYPFDSKEYFAHSLATAGCCFWAAGGLVLSAEALRPCTSDDDAKSQLYLLQCLRLH